MSDTVGIIGYGRIGRALERFAATAHRRVLTWDAAPLPVTSPSPEAVAGVADLLFLAVPSWSVREVLARAAHELPDGAVVVSFAKGIEAATMRYMDEVLGEALGDSVGWGIAGGPMLAEELVRNQPGFLVLALPTGQAGASSRTVASRVRELFGGSNVHVSVTTDAHGVALGGVLKNVYATLIGVAHGLGMGSNAIGALTLAAQDELLEVGTACGGRRPLDDRFFR